MSSLSGKIYPYPSATTAASDESDSPIDHFDRLPDPLLLIVFNKIGDVKSLGRCCVVSRRFHSLLPQTQNVLVRVDCVISDDPAAATAPPTPTDKPRAGLFGALAKAVCGGIVKPLQSILHRLSSGGGGSSGGGSAAVVPEDVTHHSPTQVLKHFNEIRNLRIELPSGELGIEDGVLLKWRADFGSTLDNCVILGASSVVNPGLSSTTTAPAESEDDNGSIPDSFHTSGGLKLRVVWTISSLIAAAARHYLLQPIISEHHTLDNIILTDSDGQGVLCMNKDQLQELRVKPLAPSTASKRTLVPALNMRLWYSPQLELSDGAVLKGATLIAIRPCEQSLDKKEVSDGAWMLNAFEEPYTTAVKQLIKRRTYCLEMNSF